MSLTWGTLQWQINKTAVIEEIFQRNPRIKCLNNSFDYIDSNGNGLVFSYPQGTSNNGLILHDISTESIESIPLALVINKNIGPGLSMTVTRDVVEIYRQYSNRIFLHDWEINCLAAYIDGLYFYNKRLDYYRLFEGQAVSVGITKERKKLDILKRKIYESQRGYDETIGLLIELSAIRPKTDNYEYVRKLYDYTTVRNHVVNERKVGMWINEIKLFNEIEHRYGYADKRYCYIDLLAAIMPKRKETK